MLASGVRQYPDPVADVRGANVGSRYAMPCRVVPDRGQRSKNDVQPPSKQRCHVLNENERWSNQANGCKHLPEESAAVGVKAGASPGEREVDAREAARKDRAVEPSVSQAERDTSDTGEQMDLIVSAQFMRRNGADVAVIDVSRRQGPVGDAGAKHVAAVRVNFVIERGHGKTRAG
jgi:hypothetical protein